MHIFQLISQDIAQGKNIDLYATVIVALSVVVANLFGFTSPTLTSSLILAVLALISITLVVHRKQCQEQFRAHEELQKHGISQAFQNIQDGQIDDRYAEAKQEIRILTTWIPDWNPVSRALAEAIKRGIPTKILFLDPESEVRKHRVRASQYIQDTSPTNALERFIDALRKSDLQTANNLEIRLYDTLPSFYLRMIDDWMLIGFYWHGCGSSQGPLFAVKGTSSSFGVPILETFNVIWEAASPVSLDTSKPATEG